MGFDTKTYWLADRQSQCDFDFVLFKAIEFRDISLPGYELGSGGVESQNQNGKSLWRWQSNDWERLQEMNYVV
jgi:hypothetical protein